ncbi:MAG: calcium-binding protein [Methylovulum miyakonense]|uniref:calcium-binding protein n=1 Tax=Methylovulum miyakonense TaxID=645578 RepID=UPI003BB5C680
MATYNGDSNDNIYNGTNDQDIIYGKGGDDTLNGMAGNDYIFGDNGNDLLNGGLGYDSLTGGNGNDTYLISKKETSDFIKNYDSDNSFDIVKFINIASTDITKIVRSYDSVLQNWNQLQLSYGNNGQVYISQYFRGLEYRVNQFQFSDGVILNWEDIKLKVLVPTNANDNLFGYNEETNTLIGLSGNDHLIGGNFDDTLNGGLGNDGMSGHDGSDTYFIGLSDGFDYISNFDKDKSIDVVNFYDASSTDIKSINREINDLALTYGENNQLYIYDYFLSANHTLDQFQFADGVIWSWSDIKLKSLHVTDGSDVLRGYYDQNNYLSGLAGNDEIYGSGRKDTLNGDAGNDFLQGNAGNDILNGGLDNDYLRGGDGNDTYVFAKNDGQDIIDNLNSLNDIDVIKFTDVASTDIIKVSRSYATNFYGDLELVYGINMKLTVLNSFFNEDYRIDQILFSDGVIWNWSDIIQKVLQATDGNDILVGLENEQNILFGLGGNDGLTGGNLSDTLDGGSGNDGLKGNDGDDTLLGKEGDDHLNGDNGNDILNGGLGNDIMIGGEGSDTYVIMKNDGQDTISNRDTDNSIDMVKFIDVTSTDITKISRDIDTEDLVLEYGTDSQLTVASGLYKIYGINKFQFSDGITWTNKYIKLKLLSATDNDDYLKGFEGERNNLIGLGGNDTLLGAELSDTLDGGLGDDRLVGNEGSDLIVGGLGDDTMVGNDGADTYLISRNDGKDIISNIYSNYESDVIKFSDLASTDTIKITRIFNQYGDNLLLDYGAGNQLIIENYFVSDKLEKFQFTDGLTWDFATIKQKVLQSTDGDDYLRGYYGEQNNLSGQAGNDKLFGGDFGDTLNGGSGNDYLEGGNGADTYLFAMNDGQDIIFNYNPDNSVDIIKFTNVSSTEITKVSWSNLDDLLIYYGDGNQINIKYALSRSTYRLYQFQFSDGVTWSYDDLKPKLLEASEGNDLLLGYNDKVNILSGLGGNDSLYGANLGDTLNGGKGDDYLNAGDGSDTYLISRGDGKDSIDNLHFDIDSVDTIKFSNLNQIDLSSITQSGEIFFNSDLMLNFNNNNQITIGGYFLGDQYKVNQFQFADGSLLTNFIIGTSNNDVLIGTAENEALVGLKGADNLSGEAGDDLYFVDNTGDTVIELANSGKDTVMSWVDFTLSANVENLALKGGALKATGNELGNTLTGSFYSSTLSGLAGNDILYGKNGNDSLFGGLGVDILSGGLGDDIINGGNGSDWVQYFVSTSGVTLNLELNTAQETVGAGIDTLVNIEHINASRFDDNLKGNSLTNYLLGVAGNDILNGGLGKDFLTGGTGQDIFIFDSELISRNIDIITDFTTADDTIKLENSVFTALTTTGQLAADAFKIIGNGNVVDDTDHILYNTSTGAVQYDADGSGAIAAVLVAIIGKGLAVTEADFMVI